MPHARTARIVTSSTIRVNNSLASCSSSLTRRDHNSRINSRSLTDEELYQKIWLALEILIYKDANIPQERASEVLVDDDAAKDRPALEAVKKV